MSSCPPRPVRAGTSLVEALVAMAVMAFGMLAVVAVQSTLRLNADIARQRSEAVRIAQQSMEAARSYSVIETTAGHAAFADIANVTDQEVTGGTTNTTFLLSRTVVARSGPDRKELTIRVAWTDRAGQPQQIELTSVIGANDPLVARALGAAPSGIPPLQPMGRHPAIPPQAVVIDGGSSVFKPPGVGGAPSTVAWVFDNATGVVVGVCNGVTTAQPDLTAADVSDCSNNANAQLLSGFVRFSTGLLQPTAANAENPASTAFNLTIGLALSSTGHPTPDHACYAAAPTSATNAITSVAYYCAIFSNAARVWSGTSTIVPLAFEDPTGSYPWVIATDAADPSWFHFRVCRYTTATSDAQVVPNEDHPRSYHDVSSLQPLVNQNFLVIRAGNGLQPFGCPTDGPADPASGDLVNSNTLVQQPAP